MEGLVLSACTAFMSFASILWLVVAKLATGSTEDHEAASSSTASTSISYDDEAAALAPSTPSQPTTSSATFTTSTSTENKRMSRRQRRNAVRKREKESETLSSCKDSEASKIQKKRIPSRFYVSLGLTDDQIYFHLLNYILDQNTLRSLGFPLESQLSPGKAWVYQDPEFRGGSTNFVFDDNNEPKSSSSLDVNAREFVPAKSASEDTNSGDEGFELATSTKSLSASAKEFVPEEFSEGRNCARCNKLFYVFKETGECIHLEECQYHWGKARSSRKFSCCRRANIVGCETAPSHVWRGFLYEISGQHKDLDGFAKTRVPRNRAQPTDGNYGVYGIDGEMLFTTNGLQLCKITVVGIDGRLVYETFVRPDDSVVDFNTRFSGVNARDLKRGPIKSLKDVQNDLLGFINANTILVGHGLENDLRALKLVHMTVIDTSLVFPHYYGMPFRRSLKSIVQSYLKREIQTQKCGHDSYEDARSCIELMLWKVQQDFCSSSSQATVASANASAASAASCTQQYSSYSATTSPAASQLHDN